MLRFFGRSLHLGHSELWLQLSIWVLIVSQYDIYITDALLHAPSPPVLWFEIWSIFVESLWKTNYFRHHCTATQPISIRSQIGQKKVKQHAKVHLLRIYHIVIQSELKYLIGAQVMCLRKWGSAVGKTCPNNCRFMSGPGNNLALVTRFGLLGGSWPRPGILVWFKTAPKPGNPELLLTLPKTHHMQFIGGCIQHPALQILPTTCSISASPCSRHLQCYWGVYSPADSMSVIECNW